MSEERVITCIECPRGCRITLCPDGRGGYEVRGNRCPKGMEYALREAECPMRTLTTTVRTVFPDMRRLPVRTSAEVPLKDIFLFMDLINRFTLTDRIPHGGEIPLELPGGVRLIVTGDPRLETGSAVYWEKGFDMLECMKEDERYDHSFG